MMGKTRLEQIEEIYHAAVDQPPERRDAFLDDSCGSDGELRREVESLLRYDHSVSDFLDSPPAMLAAEMFAQEERSALVEGGRISRYKIERLLGEGGMGEVYLAEDTRLGRRVALKVLPQSIVADAERLMRFEREARAASALNHPNIITIHEFGEDKGVHFIASEFVDGVTLRQKIAAGAIGLTEAVEVAIQISSALSAAHEAGITHRDIKPENVMIRPDGYVKVLDFGLAKLTQRPPASTDSGSEDPTMALHRTMQGVVMGTAAYMSPEQARGVHVDATTDLWSLGAVIFEMVTGRKPFSGETHADMIVSVLQHEPPVASTIAPHVPREIDSIISRALSKKVEGRYQTATELRGDLEKIRKLIDLDRDGGPAVGDATLIIGTDTAATFPNEVVPTNGEQDRKREAWSFWPSRSPAGASRQFSMGRIPAAITTSVLVAMTLAVLYFITVSRDTKRIDSIAVLPLENVSGNPDLAYISDGVSESLIDRLAQLPQVKVISRSSSFKFRGSNIDIGDVAKQLGVRVIVTGSVARIGDDMAIRTEVVDAVENRHLGGGQYRYKSGDLLGMQNEIASKTAEQLKIKLTDGQSRRLAERDTENSESYRYYLNGLVGRVDDSASGREKALRYFEKAAELDPGFANAYAEIAYIHWSGANSSDDPNELMPKAKAAAEKALAIDPESAKAHVVRAMVHEFEFDWQEAEREYRRAIELSPNLDFARNNYSFFLSVMDRQDEALAQLEEQRIRDPLNQRLFLLQKAIVLVQARRFDDALQAYRDAQAVEPDNAIPDFALGYAYAGKGLYNEATDYYKKAVAELGGEEKYSQPLVYLAATYAKMPQKQAEARVIFSRIENMPGYKSPALLAAIYSALDENDKAMELLEQAYIKRDLLLRYIGVGYEYDGLRRDPRFVDLTKRIGLAR